jgi:hypothetical protein
MINIVVACTKDYYNKAYLLWESLKNLPYKKQILCIGFDVELEGFETKRCELKDLKSYRSNFPKNRDFYVCAEGGEFLDYFEYKDTDVIVHIDADMIVQRDFNEKELYFINKLKFGEVLGSGGSVPETSMREEYWKLRGKQGLIKTRDTFPNHWDKPMFCAGVVLCTAETYRKVIRDNYLSSINKMVAHFDHHAAGQWLMNYFVHEYGKYIEMNGEFHNADWFIDTGGVVKNKKLYFKNQLVMFNHTKFNPIYE